MSSYKIYRTIIWACEHNGEMIFSLVLYCNRSIKLWLNFMQHVLHQPAWCLINVASLPSPSSSCLICQHSVAYEPVHWVIHLLCKSFVPTFNRRLVTFTCMIIIIMDTVIYSIILAKNAKIQIYTNFVWWRSLSIYQYVTSKLYIYNLSIAAQYYQYCNTKVGINT